VNSNELHFLVDREIPEVVEIPRFVPGWIGKSNCLLGSNFVEGVQKIGPIFGNDGELCISAKNARFARGKNSASLIVMATFTKVKRVGVGAHARVLPVEGEDDARLLCDCGIGRLETGANLFKRRRLAENEVKIFREAIIDHLLLAICQKLEFREKPCEDLQAALVRKEARLRALWNTRLSYQMAALPPFEQSFVNCAAPSIGPTCPSAVPPNGEMAGRYGKKLLVNVRWKQKCAATIGLGRTLSAST
jgi:hypothetical protein